MPPGMQMMLQNPQLKNIFGIGFGVELFYSFVVIICSLMIYFGTRELFQLTQHKGIKYFRLSFLFFAIAFFVRSFIKFIFMYFEVNDIIDFSPAVFGATGLITQLAFMYLSSMAVFYLIYSIMHKKWENHSSKIYLFHILAAAIAIVSIISRGPVIYLSLNLALIAIVILSLLTNSSSQKKKGINLHGVYILLTIFWTLNIIDILIPRFLQGFQLLIYLASTGIFLLILYRVIKKTGSE